MRRHLHRHGSLSATLPAATDRLPGAARRALPAPAEILAALAAFGAPATCQAHRWGYFEWDVFAPPYLDAYLTSLLVSAAAFVPAGAVLTAGRPRGWLPRLPLSLFGPAARCAALLLRASVRWAARRTAAASPSPQAGVMQS